MLSTEQSTFGVSQFEELLQSEAGRRPRSWDAADVAKLLPIIGVVENYLHRLVRYSDSPSAVNTIFRAMNGLYRYAAKKGMNDFCSLAYEVAQAFDPARHKDPRVIRRAAFLALVAIGQMRCLLSPLAEGEDNQMPETGECVRRMAGRDGVAYEKGGRAKEIVIGLLTEW